MADDDIRGLLGSVQDYFVRGGLDEDARYVLGPHAYEGLSKFASLANFLGPGADVQDVASESAGVMEGDPAAFVGLPAALAMMALPGSKSGVSSSIKDVVDFSSARRAKAIPDDIKYKAAVEDQQPLQTKGEIDSYTGEQLTRNIHDIAKEITLRVLSRPSGTPTPDEQKLMGLVLEQMDLAPKAFGPNSKQVSERMDELSKQILDLDETAKGVDDAVDSGLSSIAMMALPGSKSGVEEAVEKSRVSIFPKPERMFDEGSRPSGGEYIDPKTNDVLTGKNISSANISVKEGRPAFTGIADDVAEVGSSGKGTFKTKTNLFKKSAGWKWMDGPEEYADLPTLVSVQQKGKHYYTVDADFPAGVNLTRYADSPSEPRLRPTLQAQPVELGNVIGTISVRGKEHPVYNRIVAKAAGGLVQRNPYNYEPKAI